MGITVLNPREGFTTHLGEREAVRVIITEHGKRVFKQSALGGVLFSVGLAVVLNRFGTKTSYELRGQVAETVSKAAETIEENVRMKP